MRQVGFSGLGLRLGIPFGKVSPGGVLGVQATVCACMRLVMGSGLCAYWDGPDGGLKKQASELRQHCRSGSVFQQAKGDFINVYTDKTIFDQGRCVLRIICDYVK